MNSLMIASLYAVHVIFHYIMRHPHNIFDTPLGKIKAIEGMKQVCAATLTNIYI